MRGPHYGLNGRESTDPPPSAVLFCGLICSPEVTRSCVFERLTEIWGNLEFISRRIPFSYTTYYYKEMGEGLFRKFVTFRNTVAQESLPDLKKASRKIEADFLHPNGGRMVNLDPGLLLPDRLVLATTKPAAHRAYLGSGVYADVALIFERKSYRALPWTYPDYAQEETIGMLNSLRIRYRHSRIWINSSS